MGLGGYIDRVMYDSGGHTGKTYYARWVLKATGQIWDNVSEEVSLSTSWADSAVALTETGTTGQFPVEVPENIPAGVYDIIVYEQAGANPANTDDVEKQYDTSVGSIFRF